MAMALSFRQVVPRAPLDEFAASHMARVPEPPATGVLLLW